MTDIFKSESYVKYLFLVLFHLHNSPERPNAKRSESQVLAALPGSKEWAAVQGGALCTVRIRPFLLASREFS